MEFVFGVFAVVAECGAISAAVFNEIKVYRGLFWVGIALCGGDATPVPLGI